MTKMWIVQFDPVLSDKEKNLKTITEHIEIAARKGTELIIFPECALTGYMIESTEELVHLAEPISGPSVKYLSTLCDKHTIYIAVGLLLEQDGKYFNSVALIGPNGFISTYSKTHLSGVGADKFVSAGNDTLDLIETPFGKIGILICYEIRFPEAARVLALKGCQLILNISNWPSGAEVNPGLFIRARAAENNIYVIGSNRSGEEKGIKFIGRSSVINPEGDVIITCSDKETVLKVDINISEVVPGIKHLPASDIQLNIFDDRRPDLYHSLTE